MSRRHLLRSKNELDAVVSRESSFLMNNLLFVAAAFAVLWGTVFPLISEAVRGVKITVGAPFFNQVTIPIFLGLVALTGICPLIAWRRASASNLRRNFLGPATFGLLVGASLFALGIRHVYALIAFTLASFVMATLASEFYRGTRARREITQRSWLRSLGSLVGRNRRRYGGYVVHFGVVLFLIGATGKAFVTETTATMAVGDSLQIRDYTVTYQGQSAYPSRNRYVMAAEVEVAKRGQPVDTLMPQRRLYRGSEQATTEPAIRSTLKEDLYVILAGFDGDRANFKVIVNPLTIWLWISGIVLTIGTVIAIWPDKRGRRAAPVRYLRDAKVEPYATAPS
jgi:cytochrome c-type biogenesis protein CcmF